jgi:hypothetical protein
VPIITRYRYLFALLSLAILTALAPSAGQPPTADRRPPSLTEAVVGRRPSAVIPADRSFQPVVLTGDDVPDLLGSPVDELFLYTYQGGAWVQIPFQVDEKTTNEEGQRVYTAAGDGLLDGDEELVFMLGDLGDQAPRSAWVEGADADQRYEVRVDVGDGVSKWGYLYHGAGLSRTFTQDYVRFVGSAERIIAQNYTVAFLPEAFGLGELTLNNSGLNILDRTKIRLQVSVPIIGSVSFTEEDLPLERPAVTPVKDGPVRLILGERGSFAYGSLFHTQMEVNLSDNLPPLTTLSYLRLSTDFNAQAVATSTPTIYLDATLDQPVDIDGQPDAVPREPVPAWRQISHSTGTIIEVSDVSGLGGQQYNYYRDNTQPAENDTGDGHSYGEFGFEVEGPEASFRVESTWLILPPTRDRVGPAYAAILTTPLPITVTSQTPGGPEVQVYLPLIRR